MSVHDGDLYLFFFNEASVIYFREIVLGIFEVKNGSYIAKDYILSLV